MHCKSSSGRLHCIYIRANEDPRVSTQTVENYLFTVRLHARASNQIFIYTTIQSYTSPVMSQKSYLGDEIPLCGVQRWESFLHVSDGDLSWVQVTYLRMYLPTTHRPSLWHHGLECQALKNSLALDVCRGNTEQCLVQPRTLFNPFCYHSYNRKVICCSSRIMPAHIIPMLLNMLCYITSLARLV